MAKQSPAVEIRITGSNQAEIIREAYQAKTEADRAAERYDLARKGDPKNKKPGATEIIISKVVSYWKKASAPVFGKFQFILPDGEVKEVNCQNQQSRKNFEVQELRDILEKLNEGVQEDSRLKPADVFDVSTTQSLNQDVLGPKVREVVFTALSELETRLKKDGLLKPEKSLIQTDKKVVLAEHAIPRILAVSPDPEAALKHVKNPLVTAFVDPKK